MIKRKKIILSKQRLNCIIFKLSGYNLGGVQPRPLMDRSVCNDACKMHVGMGPRIPACTCTVKVFDVCACACAFLVPGKRSRLEIHHLARATYTSNTLQVSQLTPSQTFHFVVQRARHGARWFPQVGAFTVRCYSLFLVSKVHGRGDGNRAEVHGHPWILDTEDLRFFFIFNIDNLDRAARYLM